MVGLLLIVAGCSSNPEIYSASSSGDGLTLDLSMNACHGEYTPVVGVSADQASVKITDSRSRVSFAGDDCADSVRVTLDSPLGDRLLVNSSDGSVIDVTYEPWNQTKYTDAQYLAALEAAADCVAEREPDALVSIDTHPDGYLVLHIESRDLGDGEYEIGEPPASGCRRTHIEPLTR